MQREKKNHKQLSMDLQPRFSQLSQQAIQSLSYFFSHWVTSEARGQKMKVKIHLS